MAARGITVIGTVWVAKQFCSVLCVRYEFTPPNLQNNLTAYVCPSLYATDLAAATEASSLHIIMKCVTSSYNSLDDPLHLPAYADNPPSTRAAADRMRSYVRWGADWRHEVKFSNDAYRKARLMPSSMSDLEMLMQIPTSMSQWKISWLVWRIKRRVITVITATSNRNIFLCLSSQWTEFLGRRL